MKSSTLILTGLTMLTAGALANTTLSAQHVQAATEDGHDMHSAHQVSDLPNEPGQAAFATIAEIVALLDADPNTDWSKVNVSALRDHLVDMNSLMVGASVDRLESDGELTFMVSGDGKVLRAIQAMVPAHAEELDKLGPWSVEAATTPTGAVLAVKTATANEADKVRALGFFGLMTLGSHHQQHHLAMAKGMMNH